ncbi:MAG: ABC transporter ATP-binding protein [Deltaproteobacteria bacterium]|jgi:peptide/nickel transport system ATP-binding protein/oligopeptide transport system ATP-binding protein|nr:ABC transporter ATP-binding protein [Deltaproteobacteria bacterium]
MTEEATDILTAKRLYKAYDLKKRPRDYQVYNLSLNLKQSEILGLVGESGSGKSTLGKMLLMLEKPTKGKIIFEGEDISKYNYNKMRMLRNRIQMVFQGTANSFNPYLTVQNALLEPLNNFGVGEDEDENVERIERMLKRVGLGPEFMSRYPSEMSGGQLQRVGIARGLILNPRFVVCDEPTSSIDQAVKGKILRLLKRLRNELGSTYLFISHDLAAVKAVCNRVAVMYLGNLVEVLPSSDAQPLHPYTLALNAASLSTDPRKKTKKKVLFKEGEEMVISRQGCIFQNRCLFSFPQCFTERPRLIDRGGEHFVSCHLKEIPDYENI